MLLPVTRAADSRSVDVTKAYPMLRASFALIDIKSGIVVVNE